MLLDQLDRGEISPDGFFQQAGKLSELELQQLLELILKRTVGQMVGDRT